MAIDDSMLESDLGEIIADLTEDMLWTNPSSVEETIAITRSEIVTDQEFEGSGNVYTNHSFNASCLLSSFAVPTVFCQETDTVTIGGNEYRIAESIPDQADVGLKITLVRESG